MAVFENDWGMSGPISPFHTAEPPLPEFYDVPGPTFWESLSEGLSVAGKSYGQWLKLDAQAEANKLQAELARMRIQQGMTGAVGPGMGGMNWLTIVAFGGVGILIVLMLRK